MFLPLEFGVITNSVEPNFKCQYEVEVSSHCEGLLSVCAPICVISAEKLNHIKRLQSQHYSW